MSGAETLKAIRFVAAPEDGGRSLAHALRARMAGLSAEAARRTCRTGKVSVAGHVCLEPGRVMAAGEEVSVDPRARRAAVDTVPPEPWGGPTVRHLDGAVVVVEKPPGVVTVPYADEAGPPSLKDRVARMLARHGSRHDPPIWVVQRLDKETSGLIAFARTEAAASALQGQLRARTAGRRYLAIVAGRPRREGRVESFLGVVRADGLRGSVPVPSMGKRAVTHFRLVEPLAAGAALVECRLETGRTHQIRIHMADEGHPVLGDRVYGRGAGAALPPAPRLCLHAASLSFQHPERDERLMFESPLPDDLVAYLRVLRGTRPRVGDDPTPGRGGVGSARGGSGGDLGR